MNSLETICAVNAEIYLNEAAIKLRAPRASGQEQSLGGEIAGARFVGVAYADRKTG